MAFFQFFGRKNFGGLFLFLVLVLSPLCSFGADQRVQRLVDIAKAYSAQGNHQLAINAFEQAIKMNPSDLSLYYERALVLGRSGFYSQAIKDFTFIINQDNMNNQKKFPHATRFRADCYIALGHYQRAIQDYNAFLRTAPNDGKVWSYMAEALSLNHRNDLALAAIRRGLATGSHWSKRLKTLQRQIMTGTKITPHKPLSN